jgi:hypothetical protein
MPFKSRVKKVAEVKLAATESPELVPELVPVVPEKKQRKSRAKKVAVVPLDSSSE